MLLLKHAEGASTGRCNQIRAGAEAWMWLAQLKLHINTGHLPKMGEIFGSGAHVCQPLWRAAVLLSVPPSLLKADSKEAAAALNPAAEVVTLTYKAGFVKAPKRRRLAEKSQRVVSNHPGSSSQL